MKKLVLALCLFMLGGSTAAFAQEPVKPATAQTEEKKECSTEEKKECTEEKKECTEEKKECTEEKKEAEKAKTENPVK